MDSTALFRLGGWSAVTGGALMILDVIVHLFVDDTFVAQNLGDLPHELWHIPGIIGLVLALFGLVAIYLKQARETGGWGLWGFVLLVVGLTIGAIYSSVFHGLFLPAIEALEPGLFERVVDNTTGAQFVRGVIVQGVGLGLGAVLFGVATIRGQVFSGFAGWLFIFAAVLAAANQIFPAGQLISRTLFGLAFVVLGLTLQRQSAQ
jgi:hypothetical protein